VWAIGLGLSPFSLLTNHMNDLLFEVVNYTDWILPLAIWVWNMFVLKRGGGL